MAKKYITLRKLNKKTGKKEGPVLFAEVNGYYFTLGGLGVECWTVPERVGIWTKGPDGREAKIGAIGVRVRRWVTMHGFSVNLAPDLSHFTGIVPCGIDEFGVTSLADLGIALAPQAWDEALKAHAPAFLAALEQQDAS